MYQVTIHRLWRNTLIFEPYGKFKIEYFKTLNEAYSYIEEHKSKNRGIHDGSHGDEFIISEVLHREEHIFKKDNSTGLYVISYS